jgi:hypothetical protein
MLNILDAVILNILMERVEQLERNHDITDAESEENCLLEHIKDWVGKYLSKLLRIHKVNRLSELDVYFDSVSVLGKEITDVFCLEVRTKVIATILSGFEEEETKSAAEKILNQLLL